MSSAELFSRARRVIPGGVNSPVRAFGAVGGTPVFIESASGPWLFDADGRRLVDLVGSWGPAILGHAHPEVVAAVRAAARRGLSFGAPTRAETELAEEICARSACEMVRFVSTGTEATMTAIRLARAATGRELVVKFAGCYHGHSDGLLAQAGSGVATAGLPGSAGVPAPTAAQTIVVDYNDLGAVEAAFAAHPGRIAAVITEAVPANMGVVPPRAGFNADLARVTRREGALLILDEVLTGFRAGPRGWWGVERDAGAGFDADLYAFGKVVGGGMPLAAVGGSAALMEQLAPLGPVYQAGTLSGNPLATAAGLATLRLADASVYESLAARADQLVDALVSSLDAAGVPHRVQRAAAMFSVFLGPEPARAPVVDYQGARGQDTEAFAGFFHAMLDSGVHLPPSGFEVWNLSAAHDDEAMDAIVSALPRAAEQASTRGRRDG